MVNMIDVNNIFIPMIILTNYNGYKKIVKDTKNKLDNTISFDEKDQILNECKHEIIKWHNHFVITSFIILFAFIALFILGHFYLKLSYNDYLISFLILIYIICFILEKYRNTDSIMDEIEEYAKEIGFFDLEQIKIF